MVGRRRRSAVGRGPFSMKTSWSCLRRDNAPERQRARSRATSCRPFDLVSEGRLARYAHGSVRAETGRGPNSRSGSTFLTVSGASSSDGDQVRTAELLAALSLVTDLARRFPLEHGLHSTLVAMRLRERLGVDKATARNTYYGCLL